MLVWSWFNSLTTSFTHAKTYQINKQNRILPSFLFIFFLKELFYFLWFPEIWNNWCPVIIEAQPDVFADLWEGGTGMKGVGGKQRIGVGVVVKPGQRREKSRGGKGWARRGGGVGRGECQWSWLSNVQKDPSKESKTDSKNNNRK